MKNTLYMLRQYMPFAYGRIYHERSCQKANLEKEFL